MKIRINKSRVLNPSESSWNKTLHTVGQQVKIDKPKPLPIADFASKSAHPLASWNMCFRVIDVNPHIKDLQSEINR